MIAKITRSDNFLIWRFVGIIFIASRLWTALFVYLGHCSRPFLAPISGGWVGVSNWWLNPWTTFDSYNFISVALHGHELKTANFFPLYPFLLKLAGPEMLPMAFWGVLISNVALLVGLYYLYRLTSIDAGLNVARITIVVLAFFPTTAFFSAVYSESLFLALSVAAIYCVRKNHWWWAAMWAALAALTRNSGPLLAVMMAMEWWSAHRRGQDLPKFSLLSAAAPALAFIAAQGWLAFQMGGVLPNLHAQKLYDRHLSWPWTPIYLDLIDLFPNGGVHPDTLLNLFVAIIVFILVLRNWRKFPKSYSFFTLGINLMNLCYSTAHWPHTASSARFQMSTFPFSQMLAQEAEPSTKSRMRKLLLLAIYLVISAVMSWLFGKKSFIG